MAASRAIEDFFDELSNWYIRRSRARFWSPGGRADPAALATLHEALVTLARLLAPFMPFLAEELYQNLVRSVDPSAPESVHLGQFPQVDPRLENPTLVEQMARVRLLASLGNAVRKQVGIPVRRPLRAVRVATSGAHAELPEELWDVLKDELNVKSVEVSQDLSEAVQQRAETNPKLLGPKYGKEYPRMRQALQAGQFTVGEDGRVRVLEYTLEPDEVSVTVEPAPGQPAAVERGVVVLLDTTLTPELVAEGRARELVRLIQDARKSVGLDVSDRIAVQVQAPRELAEAVEAHRAYVSREVLATDLDMAAELDGQASERVADEIDGMPVTFAIRKVVPVPVSA
jgi:isoleucyl-tRNA synthetase